MHGIELQKKAFFTANNAHNIPTSMATRPPAAAPAMAGKGTPAFPPGLLSTPLLCCCPDPVPRGPRSSPRGAGAGAVILASGATKVDGLGAKDDTLGGSLEAAGNRGAGAGSIGA